MTVGLLLPADPGGRVPTTCGLTARTAVGSMLGALEENTGSGKRGSEDGGVTVGAEEIGIAASDADEDEELVTTLVTMTISPTTLSSVSEM